MRECQKQTCGDAAAARVAVRYQLKEILVSALAGESDRRFLELCDRHAARLTPPHGWSLRDERRAPSTERSSFGDDPFASAI